jgi:hypothetical protein
MMLLSSADRRLCSYPSHSLKKRAGVAMSHFAPLAGPDGYVPTMKAAELGLKIPLSLLWLNLCDASAFLCIEWRATPGGTYLLECLLHPIQGHAPTTTSSLSEDMAKVEVNTMIIATGYGVAPFPEAAMEIDKDQIVSLTGALSLQKSQKTCLSLGEVSLG